jgi:hypothetical protein
MVVQRHKLIRPQNLDDSPVSGRVEVHPSFLIREIARRRDVPKTGLQEFRPKCRETVAEEDEPETRGAVARGEVHANYHSWKSTWFGLTSRPKSLPKYGELFYMTSARCPDCKFAARATAQLNGPLQCRRNPPSVFMFPIGNAVLGKQQISMNTTFPQVDATTWCGEFESKAAGFGRKVDVNEIRRSIPINPDEVFGGPAGGGMSDCHVTSPEPQRAPSADRG